MRRAKHAAMLLTMATALGWSGPAADARASRLDRTLAIAQAVTEAPVAPTLERSNGPLAESDWRYVSARR